MTLIIHAFFCYHRNVSSNVGRNVGRNDKRNVGSNIGRIIRRNVDRGGNLVGADEISLTLDQIKRRIYRQTVRQI